MLISEILCNDKMWWLYFWATAAASFIHVSVFWSFGSGVLSLISWLREFDLTNSTLSSEFGFVFAAALHRNNDNSWFYAKWLLLCRVCEPSKFIRKRFPFSVFGINTHLLHTNFTVWWRTLVLLLFFAFRAFIGQCEPYGRLMVWTIKFVPRFFDFIVSTVHR